MDMFPAKLISRGISSKIFKFKDGANGLTLVAMSI